jgi:hypothetical protein
MQNDALVAPQKAHKTAFPIQLGPENHGNRTYISVGMVPFIDVPTKPRDFKKLSLPLQSNICMNSDTGPSSSVMRKVVNGSAAFAIIGKKALRGPPFLVS